MVKSKTADNLQADTMPARNNGRRMSKGHRKNAIIQSHSPIPSQSYSPMSPSDQSDVTETKFNFDTPNTSEKDNGTQSNSSSPSTVSRNIEIPRNSPTVSIERRESITSNASNVSTPSQPASPFQRGKLRNSSGRRVRSMFSRKKAERNLSWNDIHVSDEEKRNNQPKSDGNKPNLTNQTRTLSADSLHIHDDTSEDINLPSPTSVSVTSSQADDDTRSVSSSFSADTDEYRKYVSQGSINNNDVTQHDGVTNSDLSPLKDRRKKFMKSIRHFVGKK